MFTRMFLTTILSLGLTISAQAASLKDAQDALNEAKQLRAAEFSPEHFNQALQDLNEAKQLLSLQGDSGEIVQLLDKSMIESQQATTAAQRFSKRFATLVESHDRLKLAGDKYVRADLAARSEDEFRKVAEDAEDGHDVKAKKSAKIAYTTIHAAQVVAAREQFSRPISKSISSARKLNAKKFAPQAFKQAVTLQRQIDKLIKSDPNAQSQAYALSQKGIVYADRSVRIADLGKKISRNPESLENWMNEEDARLGMLGSLLGVQLNRSQSPEQQVALLNQGIKNMQADYQAQLSDADQQVATLGKKLAKYEGELSDMADIRRKLQLKREAEAKIKRLAKLFNPAEVEVLLTPDSDVILRMKKLNFLSGSAVIPPATYALLDNAIKSIDIFAKRSIRIEGHTDSLGSNLYNQDLSERRANAVLTYLTERMQEGVQKEMAAVGFGEERPIANNETAKGRTKNRRIDIVLIAPKL